MKRLLAALLVALIIGVSFIPTTAFAYNATAVVKLYWGMEGSWTAVNPNQSDGEYYLCNGFRYQFRAQDITYHGLSQNNFDVRDGSTDIDALFTTWNWTPVIDPAGAENTLIDETYVQSFSTPAGTEHNKSWWFTGTANAATAVYNIHVTGFIDTTAFHPSYYYNAGFTYNIITCGG